MSKVVARFRCQCGNQWEGSWLPGPPDGALQRQADWGRTMCPSCGGSASIEWLNYDEWRAWFGEDPDGRDRKS